MTDFRKTLTELNYHRGSYDINVSGRLSKAKLKRTHDDTFTYIGHYPVSLQTFITSGCLFKLKRKSPMSALILRVYDSRTKMAFTFKVRNAPATWFHQSIEWIMGEMATTAYFQGAYATTSDEIIDIATKSIEKRKPEKVMVQVHVPMRLDDMSTQALLDEVLRRYQENKHPEVLPSRPSESRMVA